MANIPNFKEKSKFIVIIEYFLCVFEDRILSNLMRVLSFNTI